MLDWHVTAPESTHRRGRLQFLASTALYLGWPSPELKAGVFEALGVSVLVEEHGRFPKLRVEGAVTGRSIDVIAAHAKESPRLRFTTAKVSSESSSPGRC